jgi:hypothetical protein
MDALTTPTAAPPVMYGAPAPPGELLPWSWAEQQLVTARNYWIATTRPAVQFERGDHGGELDPDVGRH